MNYLRERFAQFGSMSDTSGENLDTKFRIFSWRCNPGKGSHCHW